MRIEGHLQRAPSAPDAKRKVSALLRVYPPLDPGLSRTATSGDNRAMLSGNPMPAPMSSSPE